MDLSKEQVEFVSNLVNAGESIAKIQSLLKENFSLSLTYMDVRFLVDDLGVTYPKIIEDQDSKIKEEEFNDSNKLIDESNKGVILDIDAVVRPGALVSGTVVFSDKVKMNWQLSNAGQLGLIPGDDPDYRPLPEDMQSFQEQLQKVLQEKGF